MLKGMGFINYRLSSSAVTEKKGNFQKGYTSNKNLVYPLNRILWHDRN